MSAQIGHVTTAVCVALAPNRDTFDLFGGSMFVGVVCVGAVCVAVFHMFGLGVWCWFDAHRRAEVISGRVGFETFWRGDTLATTHMSACACRY